MITKETFAGMSIDPCIREAIDESRLQGDQVQFEFNGVIVIVSEKSDPDAIQFQWDRCLMGYLGPSGRVLPFASKYLTPKQIKSDARHAAARHARQEKYRLELERRDAEKRSILQVEMHGQEFQVHAELLEEWEECVEKNSAEGYSARCVSYAQEWAKIMQNRMQHGQTLVEMADETSHMADYDGITGFMYGAAVSMLSKFWIHGESLRRWHNKETQLDDEGDRANESGGVLNPAVLIIG